MKTGGARGEKIHILVGALERLGYELVRRNSSTFIYRSPDPSRPQLVVPARLDDPKMARRIAKVAGVIL